MAAQKGSAFLLKDNSTGTAVTLGGMRSTSMSVNGETVDVTTKDSATFDGSAGNDIGRALGGKYGYQKYEFICKWSILQILLEKII